MTRHSDNTSVYRLLPRCKDVTNYRWLLSQRDALLASGVEPGDDLTAQLKDKLRTRYPNDDAPVPVDGPLPFALKDLVTANSALSKRLDGETTEQQRSPLCLPLVPAEPCLRRRPCLIAVLLSLGVQAEDYARPKLNSVSDQRKGEGAKRQCCNVQLSNAPTLQRNSYCQTEFGNNTT